MFPDTILPEALIPKLVTDVPEPIAVKFNVDAVNPETFVVPVTVKFPFTVVVDAVKAPVFVVPVTVKFPFTVVFDVVNPLVKIVFPVTVPPLNGK